MAFKLQMSDDERNWWCQGKSDKKIASNNAENRGFLKQHSIQKKISNITTPS